LREEQIIEASGSRSPLKLWLPWIEKDSRAENCAS